MSYLVIGDKVYEYYLNLFSEQFFGPVVVLLLSIDIFISIPTLPLSLLAGHKLTFLPAFFYISIGLIFAGNLGYFIGRVCGPKVLEFILKDKRVAFEKQFSKSATTMILLSRAVPMFPEACALLSGTTSLPYRRFIFSWLLNSIPYALYTSWLGSISNQESMWIPISGICLFYFVSSGISYLYFKSKVK
jgi:uncharacterized membrane protein YdjX (TVP38/TMEM64 family)